MIFTKKTCKTCIYSQKLDLQTFILTGKRYACSNSKSVNRSKNGIYCKEWRDGNA